MRGLGRVAVGLLVVAAAACGDDDGGAADEAARQTAVYAAVVRDVADDVAPEPGADPGDRVVFVEPLEPDEAIPIEVQAGVVAELEDVVDVAFVDDRDEAVQREVSGRPVRDGAALIGLGPVPEEGDRVEVDVQRYEREGRVEHVTATVARDGARWEVVDRRVASAT